MSTCHRMTGERAELFSAKSGGNNSDINVMITKGAVDVLMKRVDMIQTADGAGKNQQKMIYKRQKNAMNIFPGTTQSAHATLHISL